MKNIIIQGIRIQYNATLDGLKIEPKNKMINDLTEIDIISFQLVQSGNSYNIPNCQTFCTKYKKWFDKLLSLERLINENKENTQKVTEKSKQQPTIPHHDETEQGWPQVCQRTNLSLPSYYTRTTIRCYAPQGYEEVKWNPIDILDLRKFKEVVIS